MTGMQPAFVTGDRVRTIAETWGDDIVPIDATGTVVINEHNALTVAIDGDPEGDGSGTWSMDPHQIEHLGATPAERTRLRRTQGAADLTILALTGHPVHNIPD